MTPTPPETADPIFTEEELLQMDSISEGIISKWRKDNWTPNIQRVPTPQEQKEMMIQYREAIKPFREIALLRFKNRLIQRFIFPISK